MSAEKRVQSFTQKELADLLGGRVQEKSNPVPATAVVLLEMLESGLYFVPGYSTFHSVILAELGGQVADVGFAGRLAYSELNNVIELHSGGTSIKGYKLRNYRETKDKFDVWLAEIGDTRKVQYPRF